KHVSGLPKGSLLMEFLLWRRRRAFVALHSLRNNGVFRARHMIQHVPPPTNPSCETRFGAMASHRRSFALAWRPLTRLLPSAGWDLGWSSSRPTALARGEFLTSTARLTWRLGLRP